MPLGVVNTKSKSIWDDIVPFVDKIVGAYTKSQEAKWENEWTQAYIKDIEKAGSKDDINDILLQSTMPKENLDIEGAKTFANEAMSMLAQKEIIIGGLEAPGTPSLPSRTKLGQTDKMKGTVGSGTKVMPQAQESHIVPDKMEFNDLYKFVSELPTGKIDWSNTMNAFKDRLGKGRKLGTQAQQLLQMIGGEMRPENQRQKVQQDFEFTKDIKNTLYPEMVEDKPSSDYERWKADPEGFEAFKAVGKDETLKINIKELLENSDEWEIGSINVKGEPTLRRKDITKKSDFLTYDEAQKFIDTHKQPGYQYKIDPQPEGFNVSAEKVPVTPQGGGETNKLIPTYETINSIAEDLINPGNNYDTIMHNAQVKYDLTNAKLPSKVDQAKRAYDMFEGIITDEDNPFIDDKGMVTNPEAYADYYQDYEKYAKKYFEETGKILPKKYLSIEEAGKYTTAQWATGKWKGGAKPVRNEDGIPWSWEGDIDSNQIFYNEFQRTNQELIKAGKAPLTMQDIDWAGLSTEPGIDIEKLKKLIMNQ